MFCSYAAAEQDLWQVHQTPNGHDFGRTFEYR